MNKIAYVICFFAPVDGVPIFKGAGIYSEGAGSITIEGSIVPMDVLNAHGSDYQDAVDNAIELVRRVYPWLIPHLARNGA